MRQKRALIDANQPPDRCRSRLAGLPLDAVRCTVAARRGRTARTQEAAVSERMVMCRMLKKELPGLKRPPFKNALGQRLYEDVSEEAWKAWLQESVRLINTYRIDLSDPSGQEFLFKQTAIYFGYEEGDIAATAWVPPDK
jgi:Fe-S cluster biosynthesis and repair protein YggX